MDPDEEVRDHLSLSADYLASARRDLRDGLFAPARMCMLQALELGLKAALIAKTRKPGEEWATHNVHGPFARHFRGRIPDERLRRIARLVQDYGRSRYPDWANPGEATLRDDLDFVTALVEEDVPQLVEEANA